MDYNMMNGLENFDSVWSRVIGRANNQPSLIENDAATLRGFIADEAHEAAFYSKLAKRSRSISRTLLNIAEDERNHERELQVEYFLLTGDSCSVEPSCPLVGGVLDSLRAAHSNELAGARRYLTAAETAGSERLRELYRVYAGDENGHAAALRNLISMAIR